MSIPQEPTWTASSSSTATGAAPSSSVMNKTDEPVVLSVEQLNRAIRGTLESRFDLVWVQGEISNFKPHSSGHFYLSLKDSKAQIKAVMFRGYNSRLKFRPHDGLEVIVRGRVTVYEPRGDYQITLETMEPVGAGALQKAFEQLKVKLHSEGLFDPKVKRPLPRFPRGIALVTSPTGAAIRDMLNILARRNCGVPVYVIPTIVQGEAAAPQIQEALHKAYRLKDVDVIIVGRGGGSMEDLWAFNNEELARLIRQSPVPIVSAVGHEIDFTIADFVADLRAPTPSAAAELVVQNTSELQDRILRVTKLLGMGLQKYMHSVRQRIVFLQRQLVDPKKKLLDLVQRNDELLERLVLAIENDLHRKGSRRQLLRGRLTSPQQVLRSTEKNLQLRMSRLSASSQQRLSRLHLRLGTAMSKLDTLSPLKTLDRGYSLIYSGESHSPVLVQSIAQVKPDSKIRAQVADGWIEATVTATERSPNGL